MKTVMMEPMACGDSMLDVRTDNGKNLDTWLCDLCGLLFPIDRLHIGAETVRGEQLVVCDDCKGSDNWKAI